MVSQSPLFHGGHGLVKKFNATVINDIWPEVFFFTSIAVMVTLVTEMTKTKLSIPTTLLTVLGTVLGLVISFRTSTAYERYQDGRKMWTSITVSSRNLAQMFWIHVPNERPDTAGSTVLKSIIEKKSMINLLQAFSVSVKHFLRGEVGIYYADLYPLVSFLPRYSSISADVGGTNPIMMPLWQASEDGQHPAPQRLHKTPDGATGKETRSRSPMTTASEPTNGHSNDMEKTRSWYDLSPLGKRQLVQTHKRTFDPEQALPIVEVHRPLKPARSPPETTVFDYFPILIIFKWFWKVLKRIVTLGRSRLGDNEEAAKANHRNFLGRKRKPQLGDSNVPLEIILYLSTYANFLIRAGHLTPPIASAMVNQITTLQDTLSQLERIGGTPLPFAYQVHLRMSLWLYLFFLPFQLIDPCGYITIPGTAFASFLLLGFSEIGQEIENPFNYDMNDLDIDHFCLCIQREMAEITAHTTPEPADFIFSSFNQPFAPADRRNADELLGKEGDYMHDAHGKDTPAGLTSIRETLLKSWMDVDTVTRR